MGVAMFEGERMIVAVGDARMALTPDTPSRAFMAYSATYSFDGTSLVTNVDNASSPHLTGELTRYIRFDSPTRITVTPKDTGLALVWERVG
jgi:hypothetical protein